MIVTVMMVSMLRVMCRRERPSITPTSPTTCVLIVPPPAIPVDASLPTIARKISSRVGWRSTYSSFRGREQLPQLRQRAGHDDRALVQDRDPAGELLGLLQVLGGQEHRRTAVGEVLGSPSTLRRGPPGRVRWSAHRGRSPSGHRSGSWRCRGGGACRPSRPTPGARPHRRGRIAPAARPPPGAGSGTCRSLAIMTRFSRPVRISSTAENCPVRLIDSRTRAGCDTTSNPLTLAVPASGLSRVVRALTIVVLPAPLEPSNAKMLPLATSKSTPLSTCRFW